MLVKFLKTFFCNHEYEFLEDGFLEPKIGYGLLDKWYKCSKCSKLKCEQITT